MTSYPVGNKTSLPRKPCIPDKKLLWITIRKSWSLFQNPSWKIAWRAPGEGIPMTSYPVGNKTSLPRKSCIPDKKLLWIIIRKSWSLFQNPSGKFALRAPWWWNHHNVIAGLQWNLVVSETMHCTLIVSMDHYHYLHSIMKVWSLSNFFNKKNSKYKFKKNL